MAGVAAQLCHQLVLVHFHAGFLGSSGAHSADPVALVHAAHALFDHQHLCALRSSAGSGHQAGIACAHHQNIGLDGLGDVAFGHFRSGAQPVGIAAHGHIVGHGHVAALHDGTAAGLTDAVGHSLLDSLAGLGGTGHAVNGAALCAEHLVCQLFGGSSTHVLSLAGGIHHHVGNAGLVKGDGNGHIAAVTLGGSGVGAGSVHSTGSAGGRRRCGLLAAAAGHHAQCAHAQCTGSRVLQKAAAVHVVCHFSFSLFCLCVGRSCFGPSLIL